MRIGQPISYPPQRLWTARTLARLLHDPAGDEPWAEDALTHRVSALRREVEAGLYRVDPHAVAASMFGAVVSGGI